MRIVRIFIVSMEEPFFLPGFFEKIIEKNREKIVGMTVLPPKESLVKIMLNEIRVNGLGNFSIKGLKFAYLKSVDFFGNFLPQKKVYSLRGLAKKYSIPVIETRNVNDEKYIEKLQGINLDLIIAQSPQVFSKKLLEVAKIGCINKHASLLPKYRGLHPIVWAIANGEKEIGVTVHFMEEKVDSGPVIAQKSFRLKKGDTIDKLYEKVFKEAAVLIIKAIKDIEEKKLRTFRQKEKGSYYSVPDNATIALFRKNLAGLK